MPAGKIDETAPGSNIFKIRTDHSDFTVYEIQNRTDKRIDAKFTFTVADNIAFTTRGAVASGPNEYTASVAPKDTVACVELRTADDSKPWNFDYKLTIQAAEDPDWL